MVYSLCDGKCVCEKCAWCPVYVTGSVCEKCAWCTVYVTGSVHGVVYVTGSVCVKSVHGVQSM